MDVDQDKSSIGKIISLSLMAIVGLTLIMWWLIWKYGDHGDIYDRGSSWIENNLKENASKFEADFDEKAKVERLIKEQSRPGR